MKTYNYQKERLRKRGKILNINNLENTNMDININMNMNINFNLKLNCNCDCQCHSNINEYLVCKKIRKKHYPNIVKKVKNV